MKLIGKAVLDDFKNKYAEVHSQVNSWQAEIQTAEWSRSIDVKQRYSSASFLKDNQVVLNIKGNKYRLLVKVDYQNKIVLVKKAGTHAEYMRW